MTASHTLSLTPDQMRALGHRVVDLLVEHAVTLPDKHVTRRLTREDMTRLLGGPIPTGASDPMEVIDRVARDVLGNIGHVDHPRFFAFVPSPSNYVGVMADALASGFNVFAGTWIEGPAPAQVELVALDWLRQMVGLPPSAGGLLVSGGSMANITALAVAREIHLQEDLGRGVAYCSDQAHSSIERGFLLLGLRPHQVRRLPSDASFRLDPALLARAVAEDRAAGRRPFCLVASAGTTNTGAVDPLPALAEFCRREQLWLHVDGAYGGAAALCPEGRAALAGLEQADSLSLDPHKWLFQPFEIGCVLLRDPTQLHRVFHVLPEYMQDARGRDGEVNFCDYGPQLTRGFRALKLWMSLQVFGQDAFADAIAHGMELARVAERAVRQLPHWDIVTPAQLGVVTFRCVPPGLTDTEVDAFNRSIAEEVLRDGFALVLSTTLRGRTVLRICPINPRCTPEEVSATVARMAQIAQRLGDRGGTTA